MKRLVLAAFAMSCVSQKGGAPAEKRPGAVPAHAEPAAPPASPARIDAVRPAPLGTAPPEPILEVMTAELARSMGELTRHSDPPYFAAYEVSDARRVNITAAFGTLRASSDSRSRMVDIEVRVGDHKLDNTHAPRDRSVGAGRNSTSASLPTEDDAYALRSILWLRTDEAYKRAAEQLTKVQANAKVKVDAEDTSDDFSRETPSQYLEPPAAIAIDRAAWEARLRAASSAFRGHPEIVTGSVSLSASVETHYYTNTEGTRYQTPEVHLRISIAATAKADDGMELHRFESMDAGAVERMPTDAQIRAKVDAVIRDLIALRRAPVAEPYIGPAILEGRAAGVFFHEVFGHRIEGHRQKSENEGQTFAKKVGQPIMPDFMDVYDDPSIATINGVELNGFFRFDNEGVAGQKASLVESGVLRTFLLGRSPTRGFTRSNGHGRRQEGMSVVPRQGNLVVAPSRTMPREALRAKLLEEAAKQGKPFGLILRELDGGFTMTTRFEPQSFKLLPVMVVRLYPDGREELVRGADLEGTPLGALSSILAAGDDVATFNGYCGAESGYVPVSASSPSLLVSRLELARKRKSQDRPPILPPPPSGGGT
ncbi:MAG: peptidase U62 [Deltaproteobacteria bacterium]|nr:peptidase U62 [Deltaproteobacteria bacterium]